MVTSLVIVLNPVFLPPYQPIIHIFNLPQAWIKPVVILFQKALDDLILWIKVVQKNLPMFIKNSWHRPGLWMHGHLMVATCAILSAWIFSAMSRACSIRYRNILYLSPCLLTLNRASLLAWSGLNSAPNLMISDKTPSRFISFDTSFQECLPPETANQGSYLELGQKTHP